MRPEIHPACAAFPPLPKPELDELTTDIKANGLLEPIVMLATRVLDERDSWEACEIAGVEPRTVEFDGPDPIAFVVSRNFRRRHLTASQKAMIGADLVNLAAGRSSERMGVAEADFTKQNIADQMGIGKSTLGFACSVKAKAEPHIIKMVEDGDVGVNVAAIATRYAPRAVLTCCG